jgi:hypothetical protein
MLGGTMRVQPVALLLDGRRLRPDHYRQIRRVLAWGTPPAATAGAEFDLSDEQRRRLVVSERD